ncbi:MAG: polyprenyl synthetase family protein, partial [Gemmataceae bacterium]
APPTRGAENASDPLALQERIAYEWLAEGGKRSRPLITLAAFDAMKGAPATRSPDVSHLTDSVRRVALAIEAFHKASLVHDDIEDDDAFRYGKETLHRRHGIATAINIGDYLLGLGYRLVAMDRKELGGDCAADIVNKFSEAHLRLAEGQGAELLWRESANKALTPLDALKIYALKTSPAFEAALYSGIRLAREADSYEKAMHEFSKNLGIAFQILNDLKDYNGDSDNKMMAGQDILSARPTLLLALALEGATPADREELLALLAGESGRSSQQMMDRIRILYQRAGVFAKVDKLVDKFRAKAESIADEIEPVELRELMYYLVDTVLERHEAASSVEPALMQLSAMMVR